MPTDTSSTATLQAAPSFKKRITEGDLRDFIRSILVRTVAFLILGALLSFAFVDWSNFAPVVAARDAIGNANMEAQAYGKPLPFSNLKMTLISVQNEACEEPREVPDDCALSATINRSQLAKLIALTAQSGARVLAIDVLPSVKTTCDKATTDLLQAITAASQQMIVVMLRPLVGSEPYSEAQMFWDQCSVVPEIPDLPVFFGHAFLSSTSLDDNYFGLTGAIQPWVIADISGTKQGDVYRRRIPSFSLVVSLAAQAENAAALRKKLDDAGLETRRRVATANRKSTESLHYCARPDARCDLVVGTMKPTPDALRINFHLGWIGTVTTDLDREKAAVLKIVQSRYFNSETAIYQRTNEPNGITLIAAGDPASGDWHSTPIGRIPGGLIVANAVYAFTNAQFLQVEDSSGVWFSELISMVIAAISAAVVSTVIIFWRAYCDHRSGRAVRLVHTLKWVWPLVLIGTSICGVLLAWQKMHSDFSNGVLSFALVGVVVGVVNIRDAIESFLSTKVEDLV
ncbi:CHASE2 domain-containing protein [Rhizobium leguminosarum]|uniref:CHASE2 domain-containing protein n=1 Tax=Rhizobium leguminosarum TaxID=384 RepID=UPI0013C289F8|nr:CHASE2 domain-containing protein [Rhizobium leguminosarum]NEH55566.1 CHASE2 domain-containing protein [Rhizobium leguminosarum]